MTNANKKRKGLRDSIQRRKESMERNLENGAQENDVRGCKETLAEMTHLQLVMNLKKYVHPSMYKTTITRPTEALRKILEYYLSGKNVQISRVKI